MCVDTQVIDPTTGLPIDGCGGCGDNCDCGNDCACDDGVIPSIQPSGVSSGEASSGGVSSASNLASQGISLEYNNTSVPVSLNEIYSPECNCQCVNMAALFSYSDDKNESDFSSVFLPEIGITYDSLVKVFFADSGKGFSQHLLNSIWKSIKGLSLANVFLEKYEELNSIDRDAIPASKKIRLHKECAFSKITDKANKYIVLNLDELNNALGTVDMRIDGKLCVSTVFHLFSDALQVGAKITLRFAVSEVPESVRGVVNDAATDEPLTFDFSLMS